MARRRRRATSQMRVTKRTPRLDTYPLFEHLPTGTHTMTMVHNELLAVFVATISVYLVERSDALTQFRPLTPDAGGVERRRRALGRKLRS